MIIEADEKEKENQEQENSTDTSAEDVKTGNQGGGQTQSNSVPYERFQQVIEEKNEYKNELEQLKNQLEEMEDPEELKSEYETKLEKMEEKSINREKEFALKEAALAEGVNKKALEDFAKVADLSQLEFNDGEVEGVEELIEDMKEEKEYFFASEEEDNVSSVGGEFKNTGENNQNDSSLRKAMGLE